MARVLCTGVDPTLLQTRRLILEDAGHKVTTAQGKAALEEACKDGKFDVAVIGQALKESDKRELAVLIRTHCATARLLELYDTHRGRTLADADDWLSVPADIPQELAERVTRLARRRRK